MKTGETIRLAGYRPADDGGALLTDVFKKNVQIGVPFWAEETETLGIKKGRPVVTLLSQGIWQTIVRQLENV